MNDSTNTLGKHLGISHERFDERFDALQTALEERLSRARSQRAYAKSIGQSDSLLIAVRDGKRDLISEAKLRELEHAIRPNDGWLVRPTRNQTALQALCADAHKNRRLVAVAAPTGLGKSTGLRTYAEGVGGAYVLCTVLHKPSTLLSAIQQAFGLSGGNSVQARLDSIVQHLRRSSVPFLVLDDCGKLNNACFPIIQLIYDLTERRAGIVMGGTEHFKKVVEQGVRYDYRGFRELNRRISYWQPLSHPTAAEIRGFAAEYGISDKPAQLWLVQQTSDFGSLRNYIENALRKSQELGVPVSREMLNDLHVGDFAYQAVRA